MNKTIKNALILMAITLISGFLLGGVYELTRMPEQSSRKKIKMKLTKLYLVRQAPLKHMITTRS